MSKRRTIDSYWPSKRRSGDSDPEMQTVAVIHTLLVCVGVSVCEGPTISNLDTPGSDTVFSWNIPPQQSVSGDYGYQCLYFLCTD